MKYNKIIIIAVLALIGLSGCSYSKQQEVVTPVTKPQAEVINTPPTTIPTQEEQVVTTIIYSNEGFSPTSLDVSVGTKVTFVNQSDRKMWVASSVHPSHRDLPGFDELKGEAKGSSYEYTFVKAGTWKYHNHLDPGSQGSITVR